MAWRNGHRDLGSIAVALTVPSVAWIAHVLLTLAIPAFDLDALYRPNWKAFGAALLAAWVFLCAQLMLRLDSGIVALDDRLAPARQWIGPIAVPLSLALSLALLWFGAMRERRE